jgi:hypothetical protein
MSNKRHHSFSLPRVLFSLNPRFLAQESFDEGAHFVSPYLDIPFLVLLSQNNQRAGVLSGKGYVQYGHTE